MYSSKYLELLVEELKKLPSVGQKSAQRLAMYLLKSPKEEALRLADAIRAVKERVGLCAVCGNFGEQDPCLICCDPQRDPAPESDCRSCMGAPRGLPARYARRCASGTLGFRRYDLHLLKIARPVDDYAVGETIDKRVEAVHQCPDRARQLPRRARYSARSLPAIDVPLTSH